MTTDPALDTVLAVDCPDCLAPADDPCIGTTHAARLDRHAIQATLREGTCLLCGQRLVRYQLHGQDVAVHPDPTHADVCPPIPDPQRDLAGWSTAINLGYEPGKPGIENWEPLTDDAPLDARIADAVHHAQNAQIDRLHGPGAAAALDAAIVDGSIFGEDDDD
jgi:hypothetical protein